MVRIRLRRIGSKRQPVYRIVVVDQHRARDSRYLASLGFYNPRTRPHTIELNEERALYWLSVGAQPSESAGQLLKQTGTLGRLQRLRAGEAMEALVAEYEANKPTVDPRTAYGAPEKSANKQAIATGADDAE
jgi:small subunit ribosomal protein S16